jgi:hypothetical protein
MLVAALDDPEPGRPAVVVSHSRRTVEYHLNTWRAWCQFARIM